MKRSEGEGGGHRSSPGTGEDAGRQVRDLGLGENVSDLDQSLLKDLDRGAQVALRVVRDVSRACHAWFCLEEAIQRFETEGEPREAVRWAQPRWLREIADGLHLETMMALARMSDQPSGDKQTALTLASLLAKQELRLALGQSERFRGGLDMLPAIVEFEQRELQKRIYRFRSLVPERWIDRQSDTGAFADMRYGLKEFRDKVLAHSGAVRPIGLRSPDMEFMRAGIAAAIEVARLGSLIFVGNDGALKADAFRGERHENSVWAYLEQGVTQAYRKWKEIDDAVRGG